MPTDAPTKTRKRQLAKKKAPKPVKMVPRGPGGQNLQPAPKRKVQPRTKAQKERGRKVVERAAKVKAGPPSPPRLGKIGGGTIKKKKSGTEQFAAGALSLAQAGNPVNAVSRAIIKQPEKAAKTVGKIVENTGKSAIDIPANIVPAARYLADPIYKNPGKPKSYVKTAERLGEGVVSLPKEFIKDPGGTIVNRPLEVGLLAAPVGRLPGIGRGGVARRKGDMPRTAPRELPGTKMKVQDPTSKSYYKAKRQAKKPTGEVKDKDIERRVDEQVALMEDLARRTQSTTYKKTYKARKKVVGRKEAALEAKDLAKKEETKTRLEQRNNIYEGMALQEKPKVNLTGQVVKPGEGTKIYSPGDAFKAAERYNAKHKVQMEPAKVEGGFVVVPSKAMKRLEQHAANTEVGPIGATARAYNTLWRKNVLATHPTWYAGNIIEAAMRSLVSGVGPTAYVRGYKALNELKRSDPRAYLEATGHITKGGHLAMQAHLPDETKIDITGSGFLADTARKIQAQRNNPKGPKQVADIWTNFTDFTMGTLSGKAESFFQTGMLGKELARSPLMDGHVLKTSKAAIADAAKGLRETHNQVALGQAVDRMYGQYGKWSPGRRMMIAHYTPFIAWTMNSLNFLYKHLPADHPVLTAAVASSQPYVDEWLKDKGLSAFVKGALPSFLQGSIPTEKGYARFPTRFTPFAVAAGFPESIGSTLLPQLSNVQNLITHDINWKGQKVTNPDGTPLDDLQKMVLGALYLLEGAVPASQQTIGPGQRYEEGARGAKLVKPKPTGEIVGNLTNPFKLVPKQKPRTKKSKSLYDEPEKKQPSLFSPPKKEQKSLYDSP